MKNDLLEELITMKGTLKATFKFPKVSSIYYPAPTLLTMKDTDEAEREVLRKFFINTSRVIDFQFAGYPEDRKVNDERKCVGLHYHFVIRSENDRVFCNVAPRKFKAVLRQVYGAYPNFIMPNEPLYLAPLDNSHHSEFDEKTYEEYCLKQYCPNTKRLVTDKEFRVKKPRRVS